RILTVVEAAMISGKADYVDFNEVRKTAIGYGEEEQKKAKKLAQEGGVEAETKLIEIKRTGDRVRDMISREADEWPADLIVVGTHGRRGFNVLLMGSVAEGVMRIATKPILLVRGK
ncbi:MAG TPA: universal stress protein, partial [Sulfuricaulis sp.]|nr:universal stress protein [Sulfuricaulis sp.]